MRVNNMKRINWVDTLKGIGILLMVIGHYPAFTYTGRALILIYSFHMPLFLFIGGYLFGEVTDHHILMKKIGKSVGTLVVPYFAFSVVSVFFRWPADAQVATQYLYDVFYGVGTLTHPNLPLWFLTFYFTGRCIFAGMLYISELAGRRSPKMKQAVLALLMIAVTYVGYHYRLTRYSPRLPWNIEMSAICIGFYYIGYQCRRLGPTIRLSAVKKCVIGVLAFALWFPVALYGTRVDINASYFGRGIWYFYFAASLGIVWSMLLAGLLSKFTFVERMLSYLGRNTIYIVGLHILVGYLAGAILLPFMPRFIQLAFGTKTILGVLFYVITTLLFSLLLGSLWEVARKSIGAREK